MCAPSTISNLVTSQQLTTVGKERTGSKPAGPIRPPLVVQIPLKLLGPRTPENRGKAKPEASGSASETRSLEATLLAKAGDLLGPPKETKSA